MPEATSDLVVPGTTTCYLPFSVPLPSSSIFAAGEVEAFSIGLVTKAEEMVNV